MPSFSIDCSTGIVRELTAEEEAAVQSPPVPASVSPSQMRIALADAALLDAVEAFVAVADQATRIRWEYATEIRRDNTTIAAGAAALGMDEAQIDDLFRAAAGVVV